MKFRTRRAGEGATAEEYVLVHAGFAIQVLNEREAEETLGLFRDLARALDDDGPRTSPVAEDKREEK